MEANNWDWTVPHNGDLWRDDFKTLFDPCPAGWRVPKGGVGMQSPWHYFAMANTTWNTVNGGNIFNPPEVQGAVAWYAAAGFRANNRGGLSDSKVLGFYLASTSFYGAAYNLLIRQEATNPHIGHARANGFSVRCVRE